MKHTYVITPIYKALFFASLSLLTRHYELYGFFSLKVFFKSAKITNSGVKRFSAHHYIMCPCGLVSVLS